MPELLSPIEQAQQKPSGAAQPSRRWALLGSLALLTAAAAAVHYKAAMQVPDDVDPAESARRSAALLALGPLPLRAVATAEIPTALAAAGLAPGDAGTLAADVSAGRVRLVWLSLYDSDVEDGDVAEIRSGGFSQVVRLTKASVAIAVPVGADNTIIIAGLVDGGGGGVTVGVALPSGPVPLPPLSVGQALRLPVGRP